MFIQCLRVKSEDQKVGLLCCASVALCILLLMKFCDWPDNQHSNSDQ
jgi:hypothetical protein